MKVGGTSLQKMKPMLICDGIRSCMVGNGMSMATLLRGCHCQSRIRRDDDMIVYVIKTGCYSDVYAVVETEEEAKNICGVLESAGEDCVAYDAYDTKQIQCDRIPFLIYKFRGRWCAEALHPNTLTHGNVYNAYIDEYRIFAHNAEQAIRIAQDMETERKAIEAGIS